VNLFEINRHIERVLNEGYSLDRATGEIFDDLNSLDIDLKTKVENTLGYIKNFEAEAEALAETAKSFSERAKVAKAKAERAKNYLAENTKGLSYDFPRTGKLSWRKSEVLEVSENADIPKNFTQTKTTIKKTELKKAIKEGLEIEGVKIVKKENIQIK
jgi:hypothetical protein